MSETKKPDERIVPGMSSFAEGKLLELQSAIADRKLEALKLYRSMPHQEAFHACRISERIVLGGNRCLSGDQEIYDPVAKLHRRIDQIDGPFHVYSLNPGGSIEIKEAEKPFIKAFDSLYEVTLSNGRKFRSTLNHRLVGADGKWISVRDAWQWAVPLPAFSVSCEGREIAACSTRSSQGSRAPGKCRRASSSCSFRPARQRSATSFSRCSDESRPSRRHRGASSRRRRPRSQGGQLLAESGQSLGRRQRSVASERPWQPSGREGRQGFALARQESTSGTSPSVSSGGALCLSKRGSGCPGRCLPGCRRCDAQPRLEGASVQGFSPSPGGALERILPRSRQGALVRTEGCSHSCRSSRRLSSLGALHHPEDLNASTESRALSCTSGSNSRSTQSLSRPPARSSFDPRTSTEPFLDQSEFDASHPPCFDVSESSNCVTITSIELLHNGDVWDTHVPGSNNYILEGLAHAQSGKTCAGAVEIARALTGQDPYGKYPKEDGICVVIGRNWQHIGMVSYPMLFKSGAFSIIRDKKTKEWRAFDPKRDEKRRSERKNAPPLIPPRMVKEISWLLKSAGYCQQVTLTNGWKIYFFSSEGEPPQGFKADLVAIDEDVANPNWVGEMLSRLADRKGRFVWTAMPHSKNDALLGLCDRADKEEENNVEKRTIKKFTFRFLDNNHIDQEEKEKNLTRWGAIGVDELRMRAEGEFTQDSFLMYPSFNRSVHIIPMDKIPGGITTEWTRYMAVDPGHTVMAAIFGAIPPDESMLLIYDELYIHHANAKIFGEELEKKVRDQYFRSFVMDMQGGRLTGFGDGRPPHELYTEELARRNIRSEVTGSEFIPGSTNKIGRAEIVRSLLHIGGNGKPRLMFLDGATPNLVEEIRRFKKSVTRSKDGDRITDAPNTRGNVHAVQALEYLCAYEPKYHRPPLRPGPEPWYVRWLENRKKRQGEEGGNFVCLGPTRRG